MSKKLYALVVGINKYPTINQLSGAVADAHAVVAFLETQYKALRPEIVLLTDEQATREAIIGQFRTHLIKAGKGDTVYFHFSGHGSREVAPREFHVFFPEDKNETLVCYDSRSIGGYDLADKELAVLLHEVAEKQPHIVVCLDCCHSGSGTRKSTQLLKARQAERDGNTRPLESYLDGYYTKMQGKISLPNAQHVLLSACRSTELAWERVGNQGVFTSILLDTLKKIGKNVSYAELFTKVSLLIQKDTNQHPQFEAHSGANAYETFLWGEPVADRVKHQIFFDNQVRTWKVNAGALQGIAVDALQPIRFQVLADGKVLTEAIISSVQQGESLVRISEEGLLDESKLYEATLASMPEPQITIFTPDKAATQNIIPTALFQVIDTKDLADYFLELNTQGHVPNWRVVHRISNKIITESSNHAYLKECLIKIARWEMLRNLENKRTKLNPNDLQFIFELLPDPKAAKGEVLEGKELTFNIRKDVQGKDIVHWYKLYVKNNTNRDLNVALLAVFPLYGIYKVNYKMIPSKKEAIISYKDTSDKLEFVDGQENDKESHILFKFIASTQEIDILPLTQKDFSENRNRKSKGINEKDIAIDEFVARFGFRNEEDDNSKEQDDWFTKDLHFRLGREENKISDKNEVKIANNFIAFKPHPTLKADINLASVHDNSRSVGNKDAAYLQTAQAIGLELFSFKNMSKSTQITNLIELSNIEGNVSPDQPLQIAISTKLSENEMLIPVTFDGEDLLAIGSSRADNQGNVLISIDSLPQEVAKSRSIGRALKFCFYKMVFKKQTDRYMQLSWVDYQEGKAVRKTEGIKEKVAQAQKILLAIHGIIGDTEPIIESVPFALKTQNKGYDYDLVLAFDYENLNTSIVDTAQHLKIKLMEIGISEHDDKELTILAHSMGGLVARNFIERQDGNRFVNKLIMAGTPNGGSPFGDIPSYLKLGKIALTLGLGSVFLAPYLAGAAGVISYLEKSEVITTTLSQMQIGSNFLLELNASNDPQIPYYIIAGDIAHYQQGQGNFLGNLIEKALLGLGNTVNTGESNDIAVKTDDIKKVHDERKPNPIKLTVYCHHINYFEHEEGVMALKAFLK